MPPVYDYYAVASGQDIHGGHGRQVGGRPTWRRGMVANTWIEVPTANKLSDLNPQFNAAINPNYPNRPEWLKSPATFEGIVSAWCGACLDIDTDTMWHILGAGHADGAGNEPYRIRLDVDAPQYIMVRPPSGAIGNILTTDDGQEATGLYADGRPRSTHTYNKVVYIPGRGPALAIHGATSWAANAGQNRPVILDPVTGEMTRYGAANTNWFASKGAGCWDASRGVIWAHHANSGRLAAYHYATDTWTYPGSAPAFSGEIGMCYMPDDDCLLLTSGGGFTNKLAVFDCTTSTRYLPNVTGSLVGISDPGKCQPQWVPSLNAAALWDNSTSTTVINLLNKPTNPRTGTWTITQLPVAAGNTVTPTAKTANGTFGRFAYSPRMNGFYLLNSTSQRPYFYALD